jgi:hypothetical protein
MAKTHDRHGDEYSPEKPDPGASGGLPPVDPAVMQVIRSLLASSGVPFYFVPTPLDADRKLKASFNDRLAGKTRLPTPRGLRACLGPVSVAFPSCSDVMLSLIRTTDNDEITTFFTDYFQFCDHTILTGAGRLDEVVDTRLTACTSKWFLDIPASGCNGGIILAPPPGGSSGNCPDYPYVEPWPPRWPPPWCLPPTCTTLSGLRHFYPDADPPPNDRVRSLFLADLVWLFYFERLGIFQILGRILDEYAFGGGIPISNGVVQPGIRDDVVALVLEAMVRQTEAGTSSKVRDRDSSYRRCLGWTLPQGRKLEPKCLVNTAFDSLFQQFLLNALKFYDDKRLAIAIRSTASPTAQPSVATLVTIGETLGLLKKVFDNFDYGRNYNNTLSGLVWVIAAMGVIRELRTTLGIPPEYDNPYEYIPAAYDILVLKKPITPASTNRYIAHRDCANNARDILLDLELVNELDNSIGGELDLWLTAIEGKVEGYRSAYRNLTGIDLGQTGAQAEQRV